MRASLKRNLLLGFGISLLILIISSVASYMSIQNLLESSNLVRHTNLVVDKLEESISTAKDAETGQRGFLLTGQSEFLDPYIGSSEKVGKIVSDLRPMLADNPDQLRRLTKLDEIFRKRFARLQVLIDTKRLGGTLDISDMTAGKLHMDSLRSMVKHMTETENAILEDRTSDLTKASKFTPIIILVAAILAIMITLAFFYKMNKDIDMRSRLQDELAEKDRSISRRIGLIQEVSTKISEGDYSVRVEDNEADKLGNISVALNKMAAALEKSFAELAEREWLQSGVALLNDAVIGNESMQQVTSKVLSALADYTGSQVGALYINVQNRELVLENGYALNEERSTRTIKFGEGAVGQCARDKKPVLLSDIKQSNILISFAAADIRPNSIVVFPILFEKEVKGVIELGSLETYTARELALFKSISENIGIAINTVQAREKVQELLEETQSQSEELMSQQTELEHINAELEAQAQQLQTSEEELKVQSEELIETNALLEEKSSSLEQRNMLIQQKNTEIERKAEELALSTKYKSEFLANMSHELRTPLNSILLLSRLLSENNEKNLNADQVQYASVIQTSGKGLLQLIDEILDLSKIESGKMTFEFLPVSVNKITSGLQALFSPIANENKIEWTINVSPELPPVIETDELRLEQILKNLLSNAFKFTSKGSVTLNINPDKNRKGFMCFSVKDSGIGISPDKQDLIFEAFQQEDGSTRRKFGGTGLGLSISRELAKLLGGEISLHSVPGEGSEFTLCIPLKQAAEPVMEETPKEKPQLKLKPVILPEKEMTGKKLFISETIPDEIADDRDIIQPSDKIILIIEDDVNFAKALMDFAKQKGYKVISAVRGDVGIELAAKYMPTGILLDIQLPIKSGWEVIEALKANPKTKHVPVHMMSSHQLKKESLLKGAVDFINKPVAFEQLDTIFDKIKYVLDKKEKKVLIIEDNYKHAKALAYYLGTYQVNTEIFQTVEDSVNSLNQKDVDCVILDKSVTEEHADKLLETIRKNDGFEDLPIILFTGKSLSQPEEFKLKKYADAIVMKTANSYQRILDEVSLFLHLVQSNGKENEGGFERSVIEENSLRGKTVLLADDDVRNIYSMTKALEKYQMTVVPAMDGREALELMKSNPVDVVLMDMMMPGMDGYESIQAIRAKPQYKSLPVIAVTAKAMSGDREKCIAAGASDYISKPVDLDQLVSLLRIWLYEKGY
ncbi:MAG: response regulator [Chitinophagaceae bacterium]|nr:MAG: response regulator [Chitinophagaceae bacterium]